MPGRGFPGLPGRGFPDLACSWLSRTLYYSMSSRSDDTAAHYSGPIPGNGKGGLSWEERQVIYEATGVSCCVRWRGKVQKLSANGPRAGCDVAIKMAEDIILKQQAAGRYSRPVASSSSSSSSGHVEQGGLRHHSLGTSQPSQRSQPPRD